MKYAGRAGHNPLCEGANALVNEVIEDRKIFYASKKYLSISNPFVDVTPNPVAGQNNDLSYGIKMANYNKADIFYSVHLNKAYVSFNGEIGCEVWLHDSNSKLVPQATRILKNLESLGFKNRGIKFASVENKHLAELSQTDMPAMIIECFFIEATKDVQLYKRLGSEIIGKAIAEGFTGKSISIPTPVAPIVKPVVIAPAKDIVYRVVTGSYTDRANADIRIAELKKAGFESFIEIKK